MRGRKLKTKTSSKLSNGILNENPLLIGAVALCPAIFIINTAIEAVIYAAVVFVALTLSGVIVFPFFRGVKSLPANIVHMLIAAGITATAEVIISRVYPSVPESLFVCLPLTVIVCTLLFTSDSDSFVASVTGSFVRGAGFGLALVSISFARELLATGALFSSADGEGTRIFASWFVPLEILSEPAGAFILVGCVLALATKLDDMRVSYEKRRIDENDRIERGEHTILVKDADGVIVRRSTLERIERKKMEAERAALLEHAVIDDSVEFDKEDGFDGVQENAEDLDDD